MVLPSREKQIERVMEILDSEEYEDLTLEEMSTQLVDGYHKAITPKKIPPPPRLGMAFVTPFDTHVHFIAWEDSIKVWLVHEKSHYGSWVNKDAGFWDYIEEKADGRRTSKKVKHPVLDPVTKEQMMDPETGEPLTTEEIVPIKLGPRPGKPGNNPDWLVGDRVSLGQRASTYEVVATGDQCVLLTDISTGEMQADSNTNMERYYRREESINDNDF